MRWLQICIAVSSLVTTAFAGYNLITNYGRCHHVAGGDPDFCFVFLNYTTTTTSRSCEFYCTNQTSCVGYSYRPADRACYLYPTDKTCPDITDDYIVFYPQTNTAKTMNDLVGILATGYACYGKNPETTTPTTITSSISSTTTITTPTTTTSSGSSKECKIESGVYIMRGNNVGHSGFPVKNGQGECARKCASTNGCVAWTFKTSTSGCWLKSDASQKGTANGWITGTKACGYGCSDKLPTDYAARCTWTCADWAGNGKCEDNWSQHPLCAPNTNGLIKDYCKISCNNCASNEWCKFVGETECNDDYAKINCPDICSVLEGYTLKETNVRCTSPRLHYDNYIVSPGNCLLRCEENEKCNFYASWNTNWCETYESCPNTAPDGNYTIELWSKIED